MIQRETTFPFMWPVLYRHSQGSLVISYVQLFGLDWSPEGVAEITRVLSNFHQRAKADPGTNGREARDQTLIDIYCPQNGQMDCEEGEHVVTINRRHDPDCLSGDGSTMAYCPDFFDSFASFAELKSQAASQTPVQAKVKKDQAQPQLRTLFHVEEPASPEDEGTDYPGSDGEYHIIYPLCSFLKNIGV